MKVTQSMTYVHEVDGRHYSLTFPYPAPMGECLDVAAAVCNDFTQKIMEEQKKVAERLASAKEFVEDQKESADK